MSWDKVLDKGDEFNELPPSMFSVNPNSLFTRSGPAAFLTMRLCNILENLVLRGNKADNEIWSMLSVISFLYAVRIEIWAFYQRGYWTSQTLSSILTFTCRRGGNDIYQQTVDLINGFKLSKADYSAPGYSP